MATFELQELICIVVFTEFISTVIGLSGARRLGFSLLFFLVFLLPDATENVHVHRVSLLEMCNNRLSVRRYLC
jgi:hypothetical protein